MVEVILETVLRAGVILSIVVTSPIGILLVYYYFKHQPSAFLLSLGIYYAINAPRLLFDFSFWVSNFSTDIAKTYRLFVLFQQRLQFFLLFNLSCNQFFLAFFKKPFDYQFWNYFGLFYATILTATYSMMDVVLSKKTEDVPDLLAFVALAISIISLLKMVFYPSVSPCQAPESVDHGYKRLVWIISVMSAFQSCSVVFKMYQTPSYFNYIFEIMTLICSAVILLIVSNPMRHLVFHQKLPNLSPPVAATLTSKKTNEPSGKLMESWPKNE